MFTCVSLMNAQSTSSKHGIAVYQNFTDHNVNLLNDKVFSFDSALTHSVRLAYQRTLSRNWEINTGVTNGFILNQPIKYNFLNKAFVVGADVAILLKMNNGGLLKEDARIAPFLTFGNRLEYVHKLKSNFNTSPWLSYNQYGVGINLRLGQLAQLQLQGLIDQKLSDNFNTSMLYRLGYAHRFNGRKDCDQKFMLDSDNDGIVDGSDDCPYLFGNSSLNGCPDTSAISSLVVTNEIDSLKAINSIQKKRINQLELAQADLVKREELLTQKQVYEKRIGELTAKLNDTSGERYSRNKSKKVVSASLSKDTLKSVVPEPVITVPAVKSKIPEDKNYYVITFSSPNLKTATIWLNKMRKKYPSTVILPQSNGYNRVGIYTGKDEALCRKILAEVRITESKKAWLSVE